MIKEAVWEDVRGFLSEGGTLIGTARCMDFMQRPGRLRAARNMITKGVDALIICGGDGSLTGADKFRDEWPGLIDELVTTGQASEAEVMPHRHLNIVGLVGSIDNDMSGTDATIGCYSSLQRICQNIDFIDATAFSHQRAFVIEVMGRHCGWLALMSGVSTGADYIFIPEKPPTEDWQSEMCGIIKKHRAKGKRKTIVIVAEGAQDHNLQKISASMVKDALSQNLKLDTRVTTLGHIQRGGPACAYDRQLATLQGVEAVEAVIEATPDTESPVIAVEENKIVRKSLMSAVAATKAVTKAIESKNFQAAMDMRDAEFREYHNNFLLTTDTEQPDLLLPPEKRTRVAFVHVGAPAGGMNAATRAAVAYCRSRGHTPIAIHNGFPGLCRHHDDKPLGSVREIEWLEAESWASKGGSEIGTNRGLPSEDINTTAFCFEKYKFDALFVVGGFEAFTAVSELRKARINHPCFQIPMVVLPATISNNVPGTEYSIGSDTCLNALIEYCDTLKQSASASRRRCFVIETQGGATGYVATIAGLSVGAVAVYTPEEGITLKMIRADIEHLRTQFQTDKGQNRAGKLILRNEKASKTYSTQAIADIIAEEAGKRFECKYAVPGHVQQGGTPSPMDRVRAVRFGVRSLQHLETFVGKTQGEISEDPLSVSIIGIRRSKVGFLPMKKVEEEDTDWKNRRPKDEFWLSWKDTVDMLSGRPTSSEAEGMTQKKINHSPPSEPEADQTTQLQAKIRELERELAMYKANGLPNGTAR